MSDKQAFRVEVTSPHGRKPVEQFYHHLNKIASEAKARWGIDISVERMDEDNTSTDGFD